MYAPLFQDGSGKRFVVADTKLVFSGWLAAAVSSDIILAEFKWSAVRWSNVVVDLRELDNKMTQYTYNNVPVMVLP